VALLPALIPVTSWKSIRQREINIIRQREINMHKGIRISAAAAGLTMLIGASGVPTAEAADRLAERAGAQLPASISGLRLAEPLTIQADRSVIDPALVNGDGPQQVLVRLRSPSVAKHVKQSKGNGAAHKQRLISEQSAFVKRAGKMAPGAKKLADAQVVLNAVVMEVDAAAIGELAKDPDVYRISRVKDYELDLSETVPYIGAAVVQAAGVDGSGVSVAVLDSGIDYTHADLGGPGTFPDYLDAWGTSLGDPKQTTRDGLFPTAKVVEGYDFVGELWPIFGPLLPDEDPARGRHYWRQPGRCARRRPVCSEGLLGSVIFLLRHRADPGHGILRRSGWQRRHLRCG
jgi:subtilisin family serine protease